MFLDSVKAWRIISKIVEYTTQLVVNLMHKELEFENIETWKTIDRLCSLIEKNKSDRVDWIIISSSEVFISNLNHDRYPDFVLRGILSEKDEYGRSVIDIRKLRREAGQSWLFNLVFDIDLMKYDQVQLDFLLRGLKDLGFCKIYNLHESNDVLLKIFCENYNVAFQSYYID